MSIRPRVLLLGHGPGGRAPDRRGRRGGSGARCAPDTLRRLVASAEVLVVRSALPADLLDHAPRLRGIVRHGVGVDMIPMAAANARRIPVANVPGSNRHAVAEHAIGAVSLLRRRTAQMDVLLRQAGWDASRARADEAGELHDQVLGIVGVGEIGLRIAEIAYHGYGITGAGSPAAAGHAAGVRRRRGAGCSARPRRRRGACLPADRVDQGLIDARRLSLMPRHAVLVNVAQLRWSWRMHWSRRCRRAASAARHSTSSTINLCAPTTRCFRSTMWC